MIEIPEAEVLASQVNQTLTWTAGINPKRRMAALAHSEIDALFAAVKSVLLEMTR